MKMEETVNHDPIKGVKDKAKLRAEANRLAAAARRAVMSGGRVYLSVSYDSENERPHDAIKPS